VVEQRLNASNTWVISDVSFIPVADIAVKVVRAHGVVAEIVRRSVTVACARTANVLSIFVARTGKVVFGTGVVTVTVRRADAVQARSRRPISDVRPVLIARFGKFIVRTVIGVTVARFRYHSVTGADARSSDAGFVSVTVSIVNVAAVSLRLIADQYNGDHNQDCESADDNADDRKYSRVAAEFFCLSWVRHRNLVCRSCIQRHELTFMLGSDLRTQKLMYRHK